MRRIHTNEDEKAVWISAAKLAPWLVNIFSLGAWGRRGGEGDGVVGALERDVEIGAVLEQSST